MTISITSQFDGGAIDVVSCERADDIRVRVRADSHAAFAQWFYFGVTGVRGERCAITFENASECAYPDGWRGYRAVASYDRRRWFRVPTVYDGRVLKIEHAPEYDRVYYAYFEPYGEERHLAWLGEMQQVPGATLSDVGRSVEGRPVSLLKLDWPTEDIAAATAAPKKKVWIVARQHPGETMAEWFVEGLASRLAGLGAWADDAPARTLRERAAFYVVPNMNPDGSAHGNLRTNAAGANLNREWMTPDANRSPEVLAVRDVLHAQGCDLFFDIHGDEGLPYVFVSGSEMLPGFTDRQRAEQDAFVDAFRRASPDFQTQYGYGAARYREEALRLASKYVSHRFGCLSLTLEMPFKDNANRPDAEVGWSGARSAALGAAMLEAIAEHVERFD